MENAWSAKIRNARWRMLGHVLRMNDKTPAKQATINYFRKKGSSFRGAPRTTLPIIINKELNDITTRKPETTAAIHLPTQLKTIEDLRSLELVAQQRNVWLKLMTDMHVLEQQE